MKAARLKHATRLFLLLGLFFSCGILNRNAVAQNAEENSGTVEQDASQRQLFMDSFSLWKEIYCLEDGTLDTSDAVKLSFAKKHFQLLSYYATRSGHQDFAMEFCENGPDGVSLRYYAMAYESLIKAHLEKEEFDEAIERTLNPPEKLSEEFAKHKNRLIWSIVQRLAGKGEIEKAIKAAENVQPSAPIQPNGRYDSQQLYRYRMDEHIAIAMMFEDYEKGRAYAVETLPANRFDYLGTTLVRSLQMDRPEQIEKGLEIAGKLPNASLTLRYAYKHYYHVAFQRIDDEYTSDLQAMALLIDYAIRVDQDEFIDTFLAKNRSFRTFIEKWPDASKLLFEKTFEFVDDKVFASLELKHQMALTGMLFDFSKDDQALRWEKLLADTREADLSELSVGYRGLKYFDSAANRCRELLKNGELDRARQIAESITYEPGKNYCQGILLEEMFELAVQSDDRQAFSRVKELATRYLEESWDPGFVIYSGDGRLQEELLEEYRRSGESMDSLINDMAKVDFLKGAHMQGAIRFSEIKKQKTRALLLFYDLYELQDLATAFNVVVGLDLHLSDLSYVLTKAFYRIVGKGEVSEWIEFAELLNEHKISLKLPQTPVRNVDFSKVTDQQFQRLIELTPDSRHWVRISAAYSEEKRNLSQFLKLADEEIQLAKSEENKFNFTWLFNGLRNLDEAELAEFEEFTASINVEETKSNFHEELIKLHAEAGNVEKALRLASEAESPVLRYKLTLAVVGIASTTQ